MINTSTQKIYTSSELRKLRTLPKKNPYLIKKNGDAVIYLNYEHMYEKLREDKLKHPEFLDRELFEDHSEHETYCAQKFNKNAKATQAQVDELERIAQEKEAEIQALRQQLSEYTENLAQQNLEEKIDEDFIAQQTAARARKNKS